VRDERTRLSGQSGTFRSASNLGRAPSNLFRRHNQTDGRIPGNESNARKENNFRPV